MPTCLVPDSLWLAVRALTSASEDPEPLCHFALPASFYEEICHRYFVANVIDMTPGDFTFGEVAIAKRINYFAVAWTEEHAIEGRNKLDKAALQGLITPGSVHFNKKVAETLRGKKLLSEDSSSPRCPDAWREQLSSMLRRSHEH
jgi:hypothetical protein